MKTIDLVQGSPAWLEWRHTGIGASDIAAIIDLSPFKDATELYNEKKGISVPFISDAMRRGSEFEPEARSKFNDVMGMDFKPRCVQHDEHDFVIASLDGYDAKTDSILEIKVPSRTSWEKLKMDIHNSGMDYAHYSVAPAHYRAQVQWQLLATGCHKAFLVFYNPTNGDYIPFVMEEDLIFQEIALEAAKTFWHGLKEGIQPEDSDIAFIELTDPNLEPLCSSYKLFCEMKRVADAELKELKAKILNFSDAGNFRAFGLKATWKNSPTTYDIEAMKTDGIDVEKYKKAPKIEGYFTITKDKE